MLSLEYQEALAAGYDCIFNSIFPLLHSDAYWGTPSGVRNSGVCAGNVKQWQYNKQINKSSKLKAEKHK